MKHIMNIQKFNVKAAAAVALAVAGLCSCSDWTRPEALDLAPASQETPEEALALIRAFKQTPHKVMILGMDAVSDNPVARWQHPSSMPDSADYIYIRNLKGGLDAVLASEIGAVQSGKGTKVLADVDYVAIENAWDELQKMKEEAGETTGTQEEFLAFISEQTRLQLECMNAYGCDGVMISYTGSASSTVGDPVQGRSAYINAVYDWWNSNGAGKIIMARGYLLNIASVDVAEEFFGQCREHLQMFLEKDRFGRGKEQKHNPNGQIAAGGIPQRLAQHSHRRGKIRQFLQPRMRNGEPSIQGGADTFFAFEYLGRYIGRIQLGIVPANGLDKL